MKSVNNKDRTTKQRQDVFLVASLITFNTEKIIFEMKKWRNLIFEIPVILQTLNIKSINLDIIRTFIVYSFKNVPVKAIFTLTVFEILLFEGRLIIAPVQWGISSEGLTHFSPIPHFYNPLKRQKPYGFPTLSGGMEMWYWTKMG